MQGDTTLEKCPIPPQIPKSGQAATRAGQRAFLRPVLKGSGKVYEKQTSAGSASWSLPGVKYRHTASSRPGSGTFPQAFRQKAESDESDLTADNHHQTARKMKSRRVRLGILAIPLHRQRRTTPKLSNANKIRNYLNSDINLN